jgi:hypothetical protein
MKTVEEQIKVMQAYVDGKPIRCTDKQTEDSIVLTKQDSIVLTKRNKIDWDWHGWDFDIVQEPIVKYMVVTSQHGSTVCEYDNYEYAKWKLEGIPDDNYKIIKLVQDMDFIGDEV